MGATKKVKVKRFSFKRLVLLLLVIYILGYLIYSSVKMPIKNIYIKGNEITSDNEIINTAGIKEYPPMYKVTSSSIKQKLEDIPIIKEVRVKKNIFGKLTIIIEEYKILFYDLNKQKVILEDAKEINDNNKYVGIPTLTNSMPEKIYKKLTKALLKVDEDILALISEIEYSPSMSNEEVIDETRFVLKMNDTNTVYANIINIKNLNHYKEIYSTLNDQKGYLYLDSSNEENFYFQKY